MNRSLFVIATHDSPGDGVLSPCWLGGATVAPEPADGGHPDSLPFPAVDVERLRGQERERVLRLPAVSGRLTITDSRVIAVCRRYQAKGGGWWGIGGGAIFALGANAVSKARVAAAGTGKAAVAHARHEWISLVGWRPGRNSMDPPQVRIGVRPPGSAEGDDLLVTITVPRDLDAALIAQEITCRAARHRLAGRQVRDRDSVAHLTALAEAGPPAAVDTGFALRRLPFPAHGAAPATETTSGRRP